MANVNGYSAIMTQSEVTDDGPFDLKEMESRIASAERGLDKVKTFPNVNPMNLGVIAGEFLVARKVGRAHRRSGAQKIAVFSSLNGFWYGRFNNKADAMRNLIFAGIAKNMYQLPGADLTGTARGTDYQTDSGLAWLSSGATSANRNTGPVVIMAGDLVYLDMPEFTPLPMNIHSGKYITPNNPVAGAPNGKILFQTKPVNQMTFGSHIGYYYSLMSRNKQNGGTVNMEFAELYKHDPSRPNQKLINDGQRAAAALYFALVGIHQAMTNGEAVVKVAGGVPGAAIDYFGTADRPRAVRVMDHVFVNHMANPTKHKQLLSEIKAYLPAAFDNSSPKPEKDTDGQKVHCQLDALDNLFSAIGDAMHEQNRWIIGRCLHTSHPGDTLDIEIGSFTRPYTH